MAGVTDLPATDAQYHLHCYNQIQRPADCLPLMSDPALSSVMDEMNSNWKQPLTAVDLYVLLLLCTEFVGQLSSKQMI